MSRLTSPKAKIVRRLGINIFGNTKYDKLLERRPYPPGPKRFKSSNSEYGKRLIEKQKLRFAYGVTDTQFRKLFQKAQNTKGDTGENLLILLERRLDNVVYRLGMARTRGEARQLTTHGHFCINKQRVDIPSIQVKPGDIIEVQDKPNSQKIVGNIIEETYSGNVPDWLEMSMSEKKGQVVRLPACDEIPNIANEQMVVEFLSH